MTRPFKKLFSLLPEIALLIVIFSTGHSQAGTSRVSSLLMGMQVTAVDVVPSFTPQA